MKKKKSFTLPRLMTSDETNSGRPSVCFGNWQSDKGVKVGECVGCALLQTLPLPPLSDKQLSQSSPVGPRRNLSALLDLIAGALSIKSRRPPIKWGFAAAAHLSNTAPSPGGEARHAAMQLHKRKWAAAS